MQTLAFALADQSNSASAIFAGSTDLSHRVTSA
jgi:hypothetical protein